ncbi:berberine bridge enzyme-like 21 [Cajanus cajan]|uniref:berberine bridge enzyme-like 21 n=1 Tax=Cajanus cajan TaxID=3821 RepID=UPI00098D85E3|nr:berberine bridge enzyme-like 21 [Cajanus cajan]
MEKLNPLLFLSVIVLLLHVPNSITISSRETTHETFLQCLRSHTSPQDQVSNIVYAQTNASYASILGAYVRNARFNTLSTPKPLLIVTPFSEHQVQATVVCAKSIGLQLKIRSGGHDFEGASYVSQVPFAILDMFNFQNVNVDVQNEVAVIQAGASLGQVYYRIWEKSEVHAFAAGACPTIGVGGHLSGGGYGNIIRKYGLTIDHVVDAKIVDVRGRILDKEAMGEDLFWAIRGGGGASFGVILSYTVKLVPVPEKVTVFLVDNTLDQNVTDIVFKWQHVAPHTDDRLFMRMTLQPVISKGKKTIRASIKALFLGSANELVTLLEKEFPLLGLKKENCKEMRWIDSVLWGMNSNNGSSLDALLDRSRYSIYFNKIKSDYVETPISKDGLKWISKKMIELGNTELIFIPYGGKMNEVPSDATPFPHRAGNLYKIQYNVSWLEPGADAEKNLMGQIRKLYSYMTPFVSKNPRRAFLNYRDLDIGINSHGKDNFEDGKVFGIKYFDKNFERLVKVKTAIDPDNFFWNEQSIPKLPAIKQQVENLTEKRQICLFI